MDKANLEFTLFQREQLQYSVLAPLQRIKKTMSQSIRPYHVDTIKSLLNRDVCNFMLAEVFDGEHLMDVFDLCYGLDNLKFIERILNEAKLQQLAEMVRSWKSKNKSLVPNVFYQYGFFPLWIRINLNFVRFLKQRNDIFSSLRHVFGIPNTDDPALDPLVFMGVSLRKRDMLLCVLVPHSLRHHIKTSLQSPNVASQLKNMSVTGIYFSRIKKRYSQDDVTGSQLSLSSACESMASDDFGELYDAAYEDITNKYHNETGRGDLDKHNAVTPREKHLNPINKECALSKFDGNKNIIHGYYSNGYPISGHSANKNAKPQLVRISSDYVTQEPSNEKQTLDENGNVVKGHDEHLSYRHDDINVSKSSKPRLVQISSGYVNQGPSNKVAKVDDKISYGKCFFVDYRSLAQQQSPRPKYQSSPLDDKIDTDPVPEYNDSQSKSRDDHHVSRDAQNDVMFFQRSELSFEEPSKIDNELHNDLSTWGSSVNKMNEPPWFEQDLPDNQISTTKRLENKPVYHHGNDRHGNNEVTFPVDTNGYHESDNSKYHKKAGNVDDYCTTGNHRYDPGWYEHVENNDTHGNHHGNYDDGHKRNKHDSQSYPHRNGYYDNNIHGDYRNDVMLPEPEPPRYPSEPLPYQPRSSSLSSNGFDSVLRRSTPNSSASGFSTHELSYNKSRYGDISRSMPILYPRNTDQRSPSTPREGRPKYESQADLEDSVFVDTHGCEFERKPSTSSQMYSEPPPYQEAMIKKSYMSLSSVSVDFKCKNTKSPLLSSYSVGSIYREKEQLLNREELQESIRSAEVREWEKLLDKTKDFMKAAKIGDEEEVQFLLNEGVDADYKNEFGHTALMIASREGHLPVIQVLTTYTAELNIQDKYGKSALHEAAWSGQHRVIHPLVSKGALIDIVDEEGKTPLQYAALRGKTKVAKILLLLGANPSVENNDGDTAIELAYRCKHKDFVKLLLDSTDKETRKTMQGQLRKLQIQRIKSATSLPNLFKNNGSKDFDQPRNKTKMRRQRSCATQ